MGNNSHNRLYESNGPDVKVRGPASLVAEKYQQLARDAHTSGDLVAAEAYQQYAEHYYRLVAAEQEQLQRPHCRTRLEALEMLCHPSGQERIVI
jgi:hypothetical protein